MYEELIKSLRICGDWTEQVRLVGRDCCDGCKYQKDGVCESFNGNKELLLIEAADAIENTSKAYQMMAEAYEAEITKPCWIPVTERLPNENDNVLIYGEWTGRSGTKYREIWLTDLKGFLHQGYKPIAWMPLPEPPKEEIE